MTIRICTGPFCGYYGGCEILRLLEARVRGTAIEAEETDCSANCMSSPIVFVGDVPHGPTNPTAEGIEVLVKLAQESS
jgi:NADH:ubiquinone oxidoreductase subunit E